MAASWRDATRTPAAGTGQRSSIARVRSKDQLGSSSLVGLLPTNRKEGQMRHVRTLIRVMTRPRDLFEGGLLGAVPVGASRAPRAGIVLTNDPSADAVRVYDRASNGKLQSAASTPRMVLLAAHSGAPADGQGTPQEAGRPGSGCRAACSRRQEMQVAGIRRVGARVEMIEVGEPRRLASDEALLEVRAAGVPAGMSSSAPAAGMWVAGRRWRWALRQSARCWQRTRRSVTGRPAMR